MMMVMRMAAIMIVTVLVVVIMIVIVRMPVAVMMMVLHQRDGAHCAPSPFMSTFSSSESELRIAVVLSSRIFLYDSSVRVSL